MNDFDKDEIPTEQEAKAAIARGKRYWSINFSFSAHCCFKATVLDLTKPIFQGFETVCETFTHEQARRIADAMNRSYAK